MKVITQVNNWHSLRLGLDAGVEFSNRLKLTIDAAWLAQLLAHGLPRPSFVPPPRVRELRDLTRYRKALIGERTRDPEGAHVDFFAGVHNPLGIKIGPDAAADDVLRLCERLNPDRIPGRLTLIARLGSDRVREALPPLLSAVREADHPVVWACDPMHGNTTRTASGIKTRHFDDVMSELEGFFAAHRAAGTWPGGVHLEFTGEDVTECLGGGEEVLESQLDHRYETLCDPRLNARQSLDLAFRLADLLRH